MTVGFYLALLIFTNGLKRADAMLLVAIYFIVLQFMMMVAITLLFSTFSSPIFSAIFAFALFVIGTFGNDLRNFAVMSKGATKWLATGTAYIVPNFASLNVISHVAHQQAVGGNLVLFNTIYALLYSIAVTAAAVLIFERRNLK
jgi:ABC-type transport system involved in multi-copper enzyme maturation permease subunit